MLSKDLRFHILDHQNSLLLDICSDQWTLQSTFY